MDGSLKVDRRSLLIGAGLTAMAGLSYWRKPTPVPQPMTSGQFADAVPTRVGDWVSRKSAEIVLPPQDDSNKLYENLETRAYEGPDLPTVMVLVAYSSIQQNDIQVHRPEVCYPASGFPIIAYHPIDIQFGDTTIHAKEMTAQRGGLVERIIYWVRVGDAFPTSWASQRLSMAVANLKGHVPDGVLFRVSAIEGPDEDLTNELKTFIRAFLEQSAPAMRQRILL